MAAGALPAATPSRDRCSNHVSDRLDENRMLVTEKVFGFLLAALGVQLVLNGLSDVGVIHLTTGH